MRLFYSFYRKLLAKYVLTKILILNLVKGCIIPQHSDLPTFHHKFKRTSLANKVWYRFDAVSKNAGIYFLNNKKQIKYEVDNYS